MPRPSWLVVLVLAGCVTEDQYKAVTEERNKFRARVAQLEDELDQAKGKVRELEKQLGEAREKKPVGPSDAQLAAAYSELKLGKGDKLWAHLETTEGEIRCELFPHMAPSTVLNFVALAEGKKEWVDPHSGEKTTRPLYDGTKFHRVIPGFMVQGGDPLGTGRGGPGFTFGDEVWPDKRFDRPGVLAMANSGPNTNGSQFFITASPQPHLNMRHTIFGRCELETVQRIMELPLGGPERSTPEKDVVVQKLRIVRQAATAEKN